MRLLLVPAIVAMLSPLGLAAQESIGGGFSCLANHPAELQRHLDSAPGALQHAIQAKALLDAHTRGFVRNGDRNALVIPVVMHIIHDNGPENITNAQVYDAIRILNEDFNKQNPDWQNVHPDFLDLVGDVGIEFRLARTDPSGNCTNGITRTVSDLTYIGDYDATQLIQWPRDRYMNVWICAVANGAAGYTYYPEWLDDWPEADGIVLLADYVGSIGTSNPSRSRVLSHEVGHWLNLKHCWGDSNEPGDPSNCFMDDEVEDTPLTSGWTSCSINGATCGSVRDNVENYMEYSYCAKMFTKGQADRMVAALTSPIAQRNSLWQPANLSATGVAGNDILCLAEFASSLTEVCAGSSISFRDESYHNVQQRTWSFPGGDPATSTEEFPSVVYSTPGTYSVTLSVSDGTNTLEVEKQALITVHNSPGGGLPFEDGFEAGPVLSTSDWVVANPDGDNTFEVTDVAAYTGNYSVRLVNTPEMDERMDRLSSGTFDMSDASSISISYRYAYARRNATSDDRLRLYVSNNCGTSWSLRQQLRGSNTLNTGGLVGGTFIPDPDQWGTSEANNISSNYHTADFRIRFEFESNGGNSVYLDDININGRPVGLEELESRTTGPRVIPNPANHSARAQITVERSGNLRLEVMDALGRVLATPYHGMVVPGTLQVELPIAQLPTGAYVLRSSTSDAVSSTIFLVD